MSILKTCIPTFHCYQKLTGHEYLNKYRPTSTYLNINDLCLVCRRVRKVSISIRHINFTINPLTSGYRSLVMAETAQVLQLRRKYKD